MSHSLSSQIRMSLFGIWCQEKGNLPAMTVLLLGQESWDRMAVFVLVTHLAASDGKSCRTT